MNLLRSKILELLLLTQHALDLPGVVVPGFDAVLDLLRDAVGVHVLDGAVHAGPVVVLTSCRSSNHIPHLKPEPGEWSFGYELNMAIIMFMTLMVHQPDQS